MLIFWKERLVFLANTKTGSTSIEASLESLAHVAIQRPPAFKHLDAPRFRSSFLPLLNSVGGGEPFSSVALMREPVDWLGSWYRYRQRGEVADTSASTAGISFSGFVEAFLSPTPPEYARLATQASFLANAKGQVCVDRVFRYEALDAFVHFLEETLGCEIMLPRMNVSPKASLDLTGPLRQRLVERFAPDYAIYEAISL